MVWRAGLTLPGPPVTADSTFLMSAVSTAACCGGATSPDQPLEENADVAALMILSYEYVTDIVERRKPHREAHLAHVARWSAERGLAIAGATGDPPTGALFVFEADRPEVEEFAASDPYREAGLIAETAIEPWTVVTHRPFDEPLG